MSIDPRRTPTIGIPTAAATPPPPSSATPSMRRHRRPGDGGSDGHRADGYHRTVRYFGTNSSADDAVGNDGERRIDDYDDDDDDDEGWLPPDDSPAMIDATGRGMSPSSTSSSSSIGGSGKGGGGGRISSSRPPFATTNATTDIDDDHDDYEYRHDDDDDFAHRDGDVIEVIDMEATLANEDNMRHFPVKEEGGMHADVTSSSSSSSGGKYDVESADVGWTVVLRELRDDGQDDAVRRLVERYNLRDHVDALDARGDDRDDVEDVDDDDDDGIEDDWDDEFEASLSGLTEDEVVDELIENTPSLTQLEMEIISQEMDGSSDRDSLDGDFDLSDNPAYLDFRAMVLEDYNERRTTRRTRKSNGKRPIIATATTTTTTNFATKSDLATYPPDWTDFDSKAAFRRDFTEDDDSWVPRRSSLEFVPSSRPSRNEAHGNDKGGDGEQDGYQKVVDSSLADDDLDGAIDWLQARRSRLGVDSDGLPTKRPTQLLTPEQAASFRHHNSHIPVRPYTLFTTAELSTSLSAQGGTDIRIIDTSDFDSVHGVGIGCDYIMLVTGRNPSHIRVMADSIVRNLKARKLNERGVMGAMQGAEGGQDVFTNKRSRNRARRHGAANTSGRIDDDWMVVDCDNVHVHIMEEITRSCLNIESLWDLNDPSE